MVGIVDVARAAGVSTATVSRALSDNPNVSQKTKDLVKKFADQLGYVPSATAYTLVTGRTRNIGVVMPFIDRWFFSTVLDEIERDLVDAGYDLTLYNLHGTGGTRDAVFTKLLPRKRVDAVLAVAVKLTESELDALSNVSKPVLGIGGPIAGSYSLAIDDVAAGRLATEHLLSLGHRDIGMVGQVEKDSHLFKVPNQRRIGYEEALVAAGVKFRDAWFKPTDSHSIDEGYAAAKQLLGDPRNAPTAIVTSTDELASGAIMAAKDLGLRVPEDLSVVGIDNHDMSSFFNLTTVSQDVRGQGKALVRMLLEVLDGEGNAKLPPVTKWPIDLVVRGSTSRLRQN